MEQINVAVIAKRVWKIVRVALFLLRKGLAKRKLMADLNKALKRGKSLIMFQQQPQQVSAPRDYYEFSCSNTPSYVFPTFKLKKHKRHYLHDCDDHAKLVFDFLNDHDTNTITAPPTPSYLSVRSLRMTDSRFPLKKNEDDNESSALVDKAAEEFIRRFYDDWKKQNSTTSSQY